MVAQRVAPRTHALERDLKLERDLLDLDGYDAVILDDLGYVQQSRDEMEVLFTFLADRYERRSVIITSNLVFSQWDRIFKDPMTTAAAIDRLVHHAVIVEMSEPGERLRNDSLGLRVVGLEPTLELVQKEVLLTFVRRGIELALVVVLERKDLCPERRIGRQDHDERVRRLGIEAILDVDRGDFDRAAPVQVFDDRNRFGWFVLAEIPRHVRGEPATGLGFVRRAELLQAEGVVVHLLEN
jgi:hypothetical protein